jgi:hypothetical protein
MTTTAGAAPGPLFRLSPFERKAALTAHVIASVGWLGADVVLLALGVAGLATADVPTRDAVYRTAWLLGPYVLLPFGLLALLSGVLLGLGTKWGLLRHRWVVAKLVGTLGAVVAVTFALLPTLHSAYAGVAAGRGPGDAAYSLVAAPSVALALYTAMTVLSYWKPRLGSRPGRATARPSRGRRPPDGASGP